MCVSILFEQLQLAGVICFLSQLWLQVSLIAPKKWVHKVDKYNDVMLNLPSLYYYYYSPTNHDLKS